MSGIDINSDENSSKENSSKEIELESAQEEELELDLSPEIDFPQDFSLPNPKELQAELEALVKSKYGDKVKIVSQEMAMGGLPLNNADETKESQEEKKEKEREEVQAGLSFNFLPKQIVEYLDQYVIKQDEAKKALAIAVCDHYNHVLTAFNNPEKQTNYSKQNVLVLGPTGVGKTYLVKKIAQLIGVPFVKADATRFTETGYVGANVDDLVRDLLAQANGNLELAQYGIIYLDEADKLAGSSNTHGKDISGRGVQNSLLKLMEESEIDMRSPTDMTSQFQALMDLQRTGKVSKKIINTKHILFIVSGAFSGLEDIIQKRMKLRTIGLTSENKKNSKAISENLFSKVTTKDLIDFGFEPEFIGRLPVRLNCDELGVNDLYHILSEAKGSIIDQYIESFAAYGIELKFDKSGLKRIAELAYEEKTGARAFMSVLEKLFRDFKYELPSTEVKELKITKTVVNNPTKVLKKLLE